MGTNTDPYQPAEGRYRLTRGILEVLVERRNPFSILTKSTLALRDIDLFAEAAREASVTVSFSIGTLDPEVWRETEPGTPHPQRRVEAIARLHEAGVPTGVLVAPVIPGLSDRPEQISEVEKASREAGADSVHTIRLHLRPGVKQHFMGWLSAAHPELTPTYEELYRDRVYLPRHPNGRARPQPRPAADPQLALPFG
jgi:DNA repair photolyase